jgi:cytochrome c
MSLNTSDGSVARGSRLFKKHCAQCHSVTESGQQGGNIGPTLWNICGRCSGIYEKLGAGGKSTIESTIVWTDSMLMNYMKNPRAVTSGSIAMNFTGIPKEENRKDILAYLHTLVWSRETTAMDESKKQPYGSVKYF